MASGGPTVNTAYLMLKASTQLRQGESVLVQGASGGVGSLAVQIAKILGAGLVIGTAGSNHCRQWPERTAQAPCPS